MQSVDTVLNMHSADHSFEGWLEEARQIGAVLYKIADSLLLLSSKRTTLEEKMLASYLSKLASGYGEVLCRIHKALANHTNPANSQVLACLSELDKQVVEEIDQLLKIIHYDLNFLEQYFEHDYYSRLNEKHKFVERLSAIANEVQPA
jgi:hypothetical protein